MFNSFVRELWTIFLPYRELGEFEFESNILKGNIAFRGKSFEVKEYFNHMGRIHQHENELLSLSRQEEIAPKFPSIILPAHALSTFKMSESTSSETGAHVVSSPHQATIWPSVLEAHIRGNQFLPVPVILSEIERCCSANWGVDIERENGFRRLLRVNQNITTEIDINGHVCDFGVNDPTEYSDSLHNYPAYPGSISKRNQPYIWSCVLSSDYKKPTLDAGALDFAKHLNRSMNAIGNLWGLSLPRTRNFRFENRSIIVEICKNFESLITGVSYALLGVDDCGDYVKKEWKRHPINKQFDGSNIFWMKLIAICFEKVPHLAGLLSANITDLKDIAYYHYKLRHPEMHEPSSIFSLQVDRGSKRMSIGDTETDELSKKALKLGSDIIDRVKLFPTSALK